MFTPTAIWLAIVPEGTNSAASLPSSSAVRASRAFTVGSSPKTSSPTSASAIARRIAGVGFVTVSDRKSIGGRCMMAETRSSSLVLGSMIDPFYPSVRALSGQPIQGTVDTITRKRAFQIGECFPVRSYGGKMIASRV